MIRSPCSSPFSPEPNYQCELSMRTGATEEIHRVRDSVEDDTVLETKRKCFSWRLVKEEGRTGRIVEFNITASFSSSVTVHVHDGNIICLPDLWVI